ncbi:MAG: HepT-like ribonuclease domain-containing protein [Vicinamibacteria bacterium]
MSRDWVVFLQDILESCEKVRQYSVGMTREQLRDDDMRYDALLRRLLLIGEATKHVPPSVRNRFPEIEWRAIAGLRDVLIHAYFRIDDDTVWDVIHNDIPKLEARLREPLDEDPV